jgi:hypothetical protein
MTDREVLEVSLEALEYIHEGANNQGLFTGISWRCVSDKAETAIALIEEVLDKPVSDRNEVLEEVAKEIEKMKVFGQDTIASFAVYIRNMKR